MKTLACKFFGLLTLVALTLTSCDLFDKADDVSFNAPIEGNITVSETLSSSGAVSYTDDINVSMTSNAEINKYKDKIKSFKLNKLTYKITDYSTSLNEDILATNSALSYEVAGANAVQIATIASINLKQASTSQQEFTLDVSQSQLETLATLLRNNQSITLVVRGTLSKTPVSFKIKFTLDATVEANALD